MQNEITLRRDQQLGGFAANGDKKQWEVEKQMNA